MVGACALPCRFFLCRVALLCPVLRRRRRLPYKKEVLWRPAACEMWDVTGMVERLEVQGKRHCDARFKFDVARAEREIALQRVAGVDDSLIHDAARGGLLSDSESESEAQATETPVPTLLSLSKYEETKRRLEWA